jgi:hypothetical protein
MNSHRYVVYLKTAKAKYLSPNENRDSLKYYKIIFRIARNSIDQILYPKNNFQESK